MTSNQKLTISIKYQFKVMSGVFQILWFGFNECDKIHSLYKKRTDPYQLGSKLYINYGSESRSVLSDSLLPHGL